MRATTVGAAVPEARPVEAPPQAVETKNSRTTAIDERYTGSSSGSDMYYEIEGVLLRDRTSVNRCRDRGAGRRAQSVDRVLHLIQRVAELVLEAGEARLQCGPPRTPRALALLAQLDEVRAAVARVRHALHVSELGHARERARERGRAHADADRELGRGDRPPHPEGAQEAEVIARDPACLEVPVEQRRGELPGDVGLEEDVLRASACQRPRS